MPGMILILLVVLMLSGVIVIGAGLRGRRLNDHPVCRWCAFDLQGIYPEAVTCPECGAGLKREGSVSTGVRRKMPALVLVGALLAAVPLGPIGMVSYALLTGTNLDSHKPLGLLLWEAKVSDSARLDAIATELQNRAMAKKLDAGQYAAVIEAVLDFQGDTSRPWAESWGDLIERADLDGVLTPQQEQRFHSQAAVLEIRARPTVQAGGLTPVRITLKEARVGSTMSLECSVKVTGASVDGQDAKWDVVRHDQGDPFFGASPLRDGGAARFTLGGKNARVGRMFFFGGGGPSTGEVMVEIPEGTAPGRKDLSLALENSIADGTAGALGAFMVAGGTLRSASAPSSTTPSAARARTSVKVVGPQEAIVTPLDADADTTRKIADAIRPGGITVGNGLFGGFILTPSGIDPSAGGSDASIEFDIGGVEQPLAFDVYCRANGREWKLGELHSGSRLESAAAGRMSFQMSSTVIVNGKVVKQSSTSSGDARTVSGSWEGGDAAAVDVILRPSSKVAAKTLDLDRYYAGSIVFNDVPVVRMPGSDMDRQFQDMERLFRRRLSPLLSPSRPREPPAGSGDNGPL